MHGMISRLSGRVSVRGVLVVVTVCVLLYLIVVPIGFLIYGSFSTGQPGSPGHLTTSAYSRILSDGATYSLIGRSLIYGLGSALVALIVGGLFAWLLQRTDVHARRAASFLVLFPLFIPSVLSTLAWVMLLDNRIGVINLWLENLLGLHSAPFNVLSLPGMIWVCGISQAPLTFLWLLPAFSAMDPSLEEAAALSGKTTWQVIRTITLPMLRPALLGAYLISLVLCLEDITVPILIGLPANVNVFSADIYTLVTQVPSDATSASVYSLILMVITFALAVTYRRLTSRAERFYLVRGRGYRPSVVKLGRWRWPTTLAIYLALFVIVGLPLLVMLWTSFTPYVQVPSLAGFHHLTTSSYRMLFDDPTVLGGLEHSTTLGLVSAAIVMVLSMIAGWVVTRSRYRMRNALDFLLFAPIAIPGLVTGLSLMWLYLQLPVPVYGTLTILGIAYVTRFIPYGARLIGSGFGRLHPELDEAAALSGAGWFRGLRTISIPLLVPTIMAAAVYVFIRSFTELSASLLLFSYNTEPYSVAAFNIWSGGVVGETAAYGVVGITVMIVVIILGQVITRKRFLTSI